MKKLRLLVPIMIFAALLSACSLQQRAASTPPPSVNDGGGVVDSGGDSGTTALEQALSMTETARAGGGETGGGVAAGADAAYLTAEAEVTAEFMATEQAALATATPTEEPAPTAIPEPSTPETYTLVKGEFPYCIARRFDIDVNDLLAANGLNRDSLYAEGLQLRIPANADSFDGERALRSHPATYVVQAGDTLNTVACYFGDISPEAIANANGTSVGATLNSGTTINIP